MPSVSVTPDEFKFVFFDGARITSVAEKLLAEIGLDRDVSIEVDESTPLGRARVTSVDPIVLSVESGAFEDTKHHHFYDTSPDQALHVNVSADGKGGTISRTLTEVP